jgi:hypothetical protein
MASEASDDASTYAKVICDSINKSGHRLTTFEIRFHRFVLAEFNTHRVFSRSSASSRAVPVHKFLDRVRSTPAYPAAWPAEQSGMQGGEALSPEHTAEAVAFWHDAADDMALIAETLVDIGVHKSVTNRLLEPFLMHTVICTATSYENFFGLRCNPLAQPEIRIAAEMMQKAYWDSKPTPLAVGQWHLPYLSDEEIAELGDDARKVSAARCARVSYLTHDGTRDPAKDVELFEKLANADPAHSAPLEHVATPNLDNVHRVRTLAGQVLELPKYSNFLGFHQFRFDIEAQKGYQSFC